MTFPCHINVCLAVFLFAFELLSRNQLSHVHTYECACSHVKWAELYQSQYLLGATACCTFLLCFQSRTTGWGLKDKPSRYCTTCAHAVSGQNKLSQPCSSASFCCNYFMFPPATKPSALVTWRRFKTEPTSCSLARSVITVDGNITIQHLQVSGEGLSMCVLCVSFIPPIQEIWRATFPLAISERRSSYLY